jgi:flagellar assembly protein FliH
MSLSRKLIKNNQVDMGTDSLAIPVSPVRIIRKADPENSKEKEAAYDRELEETALQAKAQIEEKIRQAEQQAKDVIDQAEGQAEAIRIQARETGYQKGFREGHQAGYQTGYKEAAQKTEEMREQAKALLSDAHRETREYIGRTREEIIRLAASMAKSIIRYSVDVREESIIEMVKNALHQAEERKQILLRCPAQYVSFLQANIYQFEKVCPSATFAVLEDTSVQSPGCIIETEDQSIDLEIDKQLDNIVNALSEWKEGKE